MRVPVPIVVVLSLGVTGGGWWWWTRDRDYLSPPAEVGLAEIRDEPIAVETAGADSRDDEPSPPVETRAMPPRLAEHVELAGAAPGELAVLAAELEASGDFQRALLAHERIVDSTTVTGEALAATLQAVRRLRALVPQWNARPERAHAIALHAGTGEDNAARVEPALARVAAEMSRASAGTVSVQPRIHLGPARTYGDLPPPVAIWLGGTSDSSHETLVRSITLGGDDDPELEITLAVLEILAGQLSKQSLLRIPMPDADTSATSFADRVTRLAWETIGSSLNAPES